ncbi:deoxyhypusine hydroxylase-like protein [Trifolium pratense]|uniref:Deoxyhypusine hydroxylase-like protein n=1 Tax=Trifolium pratense TaxID=57577 RepID=A0A2K3LM03_TRIPR|nr:deoxyhypusine hydroxylase-like protein [Trifolium pratense]
MYERYAALFALRNDGGNEAVAAIIDSLGSKSALLKHEVAYVLGQLQNKAASAALSNILRDVNEHPMVRHEAAEALGSIAVSHTFTTTFLPPSDRDSPDCSGMSWDLVFEFEV